MKRFIVYIGVAVLSCICVSSQIWAHCEIPCGIYGDEARFTEMAEDIKTIEKSMNQIVELSKNPDVNMNQLVRWVQNKEVHADKVNKVATKYFMKQRIKPVNKDKGAAYQDYIHKLTLLHQIMVHSMKAKQTTDIGQVNQMTSLLEEFHKAYHPDEFKTGK